MESTLYVLSFQMVCFYLVTTGWIFDISLCENSIKIDEAGTGMRDTVMTRTVSFRASFNFQVEASHEALRIEHVRYSCHIWHSIDGNNNK